LEAKPKSNPSHTYDLLSRFYNLLADPSEAPLRRQALEQLALRTGESVLEIGPGPGRDLVCMAESVGSVGIAVGLDLSTGMLAQCQRQLANVSSGRGRLVRGDGLQLPFTTGLFDAIFMSFTLELFPISQILSLLGEVRRVLRPSGRISLVSLSDSHSSEFVTRLYTRLHHTFPRLIDCRPIDLLPLLDQAGFQSIQVAEKRMWGLYVVLALGWSV
jgi:ubiquinone/menaquinone biosynthesis C-methylase UbiE